MDVPPTYWQSQAAKFHIAVGSHFPVNHLNVLYCSMAEVFLPTYPHLSSEIKTLIKSTTNLLAQIEIETLKTLPPELTALVPAPSLMPHFSSWQAVGAPYKNAALVSALEKIHSLQSSGLSIADLVAILALRSLDSLVYAAVIAECIKAQGGSLDLGTETVFKKSFYAAAITNDLVDSVIHLPEDKGTTFSVAELFQSVTEPVETKAKILKVTELVEKEIQLTNEDSPLVTLVTDFNLLLLNSLGI